MLRLDSFILEHIFQSLPFNDILSCSATCKQFNRIMTTSSPIQLIFHRALLHIPTPIYPKDAPLCSSNKSVTSQEDLARIIQTERNLRDLQPLYETFKIPTDQTILAVEEGYIVTREAQSTKGDGGPQTVVTIWYRNPSENKVEWTSKDVQIPYIGHLTGMAVDIHEGVLAVTKWREIEDEKILDIWIHGNYNGPGPVQLSCLPHHRLEIKRGLEVHIINWKDESNGQMIRFPSPENRLITLSNHGYIGTEFMVAYSWMQDGLILVYDLNNFQSVSSRNDITKPNLILRFPYYLDGYAMDSLNPIIQPANMNESRNIVEVESVYIPESIASNSFCHLRTEVWFPVSSKFKDVDPLNLNTVLTGQLLRSLTDTKEVFEYDLHDVQDLIEDCQSPQSEMSTMFGKVRYIGVYEWYNRCFSYIDEGYIMTGPVWNEGSRTVSAFAELHQSQHAGSSADGDTEDQSDPRWRLSIEIQDFDFSNVVEMRKALGGDGQNLKCTFNVQNSKPPRLKGFYRDRKQVNFRKYHGRSYTGSSRKVQFWLKSRPDPTDRFYFDGQRLICRIQRTGEIFIWDFGSD
ncbi:hypothetical protein I302_107304 [Kwoniella bestiolae CBS 10118]|uniref:F-box domain-containing protein n=1 Tax=Kwoniella bestiolae CBS 10118 TaxID=1296100 RepID=A0A1B9FYZ1_9TREE|nr:hypothetical protein I302_06960 [Kwoniella bestiolae CBS 10118]OCF23974.1 hypothetical protein I302_06960 [Kwoniella bestiolae CBS 10118]